MPIPLGNTRLTSVDLQHFYAFGDLYETLDACQELEMLLARLKRQRLLSDGEYSLSKANVEEIRTQLESYLNAAQPPGSE